jgi:hypothetical protein
MYTESQSKRLFATLAMLEMVKTEYDENTLE